MHKPYTYTRDIQILPSYVDVPGLGVLPVNAFLIRASEPVLIDTGVVAQREAFMNALRSVMDPRDLRWIWITHTDPDHIGSLHQLLGEAPNARIITTFLGMGKLGLVAPIPPERVYLLNPGQSIQVGNRSLMALKPPTFDAPETTGLFDPESGVLFSSDCFGAVLAAPADDACDVAPADLAVGQVLWATVDAPWLASVDQSTFGHGLEALRAIGADAILSSHLPPARGMTDQLLATLANATHAPPFVGPDQAALETMLAQMTVEQEDSAAGVTAT